MEKFGITYIWLYGISFGHYGNLVTIWYIFPVLVCCVKKTWQPWNRVGFQEPVVNYDVVVQCD
jgi:hypothetical protein